MDVLSHEPKEPDGVLNDQFTMKHYHYLNWNILSTDYLFSTDMMQIYSHKVNWGLLLKRIKFNDKFLRKMTPHFEGSWSVLSKYQTLFEGFIHDCTHKVDWNNIVDYQKCSLKFISEHRYIY